MVKQQVQQEERAQSTVQQGLALALVQVAATGIEQLVAVLVAVLLQVMVAALPRLIPPVETAAAVALAVAPSWQAAL